MTCFTLASYLMFSLAVPLVEVTPAMAPTLSAAAEVGITPASLVVCGVACVDLGDVHKVLESIDNATALRQSLAEAKVALETKSADIRTLRQLRLMEPDCGDLLAQMNIAMTEMVAHVSAIELASKSLRQAAFDGLTSNSIQLLDAWSDSSMVPVPPAFRAVVRSPEEWTAIVRALRAEARALRNGTAVPEEHSNLLAAVRTDPAVMEAESRLAALTPMVAIAFAEFE